MINRIAVDPYVVAPVSGLNFNPKDKNSRSVTQQSFAEEVDINNIISKFLKTGLLSDVDAINARKGVFSDVSNLGDFHSAMIKISQINDSFASLPVDVRAKFDYDPGKLIDWLANPANALEAVKIGLLTESDIVKVKGGEAAAGGAVVPPAAAPVVPPAAAPALPTS